MSDFKVTSRYAKSLLELAVAQKQLDQVYKDIILLTDSIDESRDLKLMLKSPVVKHHVKREVLGKVFEKSLNDITNAFIGILCSKGRESLLEPILKEFYRQYNEYMSIQMASITTASPLSASIKKEMESIVLEISGKKTVVLEEKVDPDVIGGFLLKVGDRQIDGSVKGKLSSLRRQLMV